MYVWTSSPFNRKRNEERREEHAQEHNTTANKRKANMTKLLNSKLQKTKEEKIPEKIPTKRIDFAKEKNYSYFEDCFDFQDEFAADSDSPHEIFDFENSLYFQKIIRELEEENKTEMSVLIHEAIALVGGNTTSGSTELTAASNHIVMKTIASPYDDDNEQKDDADEEGDGCIAAGNNEVIIDNENILKLLDEANMMTHKLTPQCTITEEQHHQQNVAILPGALFLFGTARERALRRYREKRTRRKRKQVKNKRYLLRQKFATNRPRVKGRFMAKKKFINPWFG